MKVKKNLFFFFNKNHSINFSKLGKNILLLFRAFCKSKVVVYRRKYPVNLIS